MSKNIITATMGATLTKKTAAIYVNNWKNIESFFDPKILTQAVRQFKVRDFATFKYILSNQTHTYDYYIEKGYPLITPKPVHHYVTEYSSHNGGGWERQVNALCYEFIVPDPYQLREKDLIKTALLAEFPYLANYDIAVYHMENGSTRKQIETFKNKHERSYFSSGIDNYFGDDFYIKFKTKKSKNSSSTHTPSIYVPYIALKEKNPEIIIARHTSYFKNYYNRPNQAKFLNESLAILETPQTKKLFKQIRAGK